MANMLEPGAGGLPAAPASDAKSNPLQPTRKPNPASPAQSHFNDAMGQTRARFEKMKEAEHQTNAIVTEMGKLAEMADTVTTKDIVSGFAGIVAAGVPAVSLATILAEMPENPAGLQAWVKQEYDSSLAAEKKVNALLEMARHQMLVAGIKSVVAHSADAHHNAKLAAMPVQGNA